MMIVLWPSSCYHSSLSSYILQCLLSVSLLSSAPPHPNSKQQSLRHHCIFVCVHFFLYQDTFPSPPHRAKSHSSDTISWNSSFSRCFSASMSKVKFCCFKISQHQVLLLWQFFVTCFLMVRLWIGYSFKFLNKGKEIIVSGTKSKLTFPPRHHMNVSFYLVALLSPWCGLNQLTPH